MVWIELDALDWPNMTSVEDAQLEAGLGVPDVNAAVGGTGQDELKE